MANAIATGTPNTTSSTSQCQMLNEPKSAPPQRRLQLARNRGGSLGLDHQA